MFALTALSAFDTTVPPATSSGVWVLLFCELSVLETVVEVALRHCTTSAYAYETDKVAKRKPANAIVHAEGMARVDVEENIFVMLVLLCV